VLHPTVKFQNLQEPDFALAERLFEILAKETADTLGLTREAYGRGEQFAHDLVATAMEMADFAVVTRLLAQGLALVS
jgi:beta-ureidopropionase / N-carbamoyl-L-amino-acid hydrolase